MKKSHIFLRISSEERATLLLGTDLLSECLSMTRSLRRSALGVLALVRSFPPRILTNTATNRAVKLFEVTSHSSGPQISIRRFDANDETDENALKHAIYTVCDEPEVLRLGWRAMRHSHSLLDA